MPKLLKKILLSFLASLVVLFSFTPYLTVNAAEEEGTGTNSTSTSTQNSAGTWYKQNFIDWYNKVYDTENPSEIFGERYTAAQVEWVIYGLFSFLLNHVSDQGTSVKCIGGDTQACGDAIKESIQKIQGLTTSSHMPKENRSLALMVFAERRFSGIGYVAEKIRNLSLIPEAKAQVQGFGFGALDPIKALWAASRNAAYGLIVLASIILAFMIMFRVKISPQVVITVQSAIPKVIMALVFVTFSYAIAGFLIDIMYVVIGIISLILGQVFGSAPQVFDLMTNGAPVIGLGFLGLMAMYCILFFWTLLFTLFASGNVILNFAALSPILILLFILIIIVVAIVLIFMFFKILWLLLKTLAKTYLLAIVGPLQIMLGTVAQGMGIGSWIRALAANLAVYPIVGSLFVLSFIFLFYSIVLGIGNVVGQTVVQALINTIFGATELNIPTATWSPPLTLGENYIPLIFVGVSFVILTLIPKTAEIIQGFISGKPFDYGSAIGEAQQAASWMAAGTGIYASRRANRTEDLGEARRLRNLERFADFVESFIKPGRR